MTRHAWIADRLDLLAEAVAIEVDLVRFEQRYGASSDCSDLQRRIAATRAIVLAQLLNISPTVH